MPLSMFGRSPLNKAAPFKPFPVIASYSTGAESADYTTHTITYPSGVVAGDLLLLIINKDNIYRFITPAGWTSWANFNGSEMHCVCVFYRTVTSALSGTFTITQVKGGANADCASWIVLRIPGGKVGVRSYATSSYNVPTTAPNSPSVAHTWGAGTNVLWISAAGWDCNRTVSAWPTNCPDNHISSVCSVTTGTGTAIATASANTATFDPDPFTISAADEWRAFTLLIAL